MDIFVWITLALVSLVFWVAGIAFCIAERRWVGLFFSVIFKPVGWAFACIWVARELRKGA